MHLTQAHVSAVNRRRRIVVNYDTGFGEPGSRHFGSDMKALVDGYFSMIDEEGVQIDSVWWCWLDGNYANYPSRILPVYRHPGLEKWWDAGIDPVHIFAEEATRRGLETFFSYRLNGTDMTDIKPLSKPLLKESHPDWLIHTWDSYGNPGYWNFAVEGVRDYKVSILREVAENYPYDGIEIDFARVPINLPPGHQWENREHLTAFVRAVRAMTLEVERKRRRPFLLAARIPENIVGCHFDGMDVETWAREQLLDILVLGNRSFEVDILAFRRIAEGTGIRLYPCIDDHHATDGYEKPPIEVFRGVAANWWHQGADGIQTFNFANWTPAGAALLGYEDLDRMIWSVTQSRPVWDLHRQVYREIGDPGTLEGRDKTFVVERRGGGHGSTVVADPDDWHTPRWMYFLTNMFGQLPAPLADDGKADTLLFVYVADDLADAKGTRIAGITVRVLLSDPEADALPPSERMEPVIMACHGKPDRKFVNRPPAKGIENHIELRLNNTLLGEPTVERGWLVFQASPGLFAIGRDLLGLRVTRRPSGARGAMLIEMLEVDVRYLQVVQS